MAITFVGSATGFVNNGGASFTIALPTCLENDIVIVANASTSAYHANLGINTPGYAEITDLYANDSNDISLTISWKRMGAVPDTLVDCIGFAEQGTAVTTLGIAYVLRGVNTSSAFDTAITTATGVNSGTPNSPAISPVTANSLIVICGAATSNDASITFPAGFSNTVSQPGTEDYECTVAMASELWDGSGPIDPAPWTTWSTSTMNSWAAATIVLRASTGETGIEIGTADILVSGQVFCRVIVPIPTGSIALEGESLWVRKIAPAPKFLVAELDPAPSVGESHSPCGYWDEQSEPVWEFERQLTTPTAYHKDELMPSYCGHWHTGDTNYTDIYESLGLYEIYYELLPAQTGHVWLDAEIPEQYALETFLPWEPEAYDGVISFEFEVICFNKKEFDVTITLSTRAWGGFSYSYAEVVSIVVPAGSVGSTGYELFRFRTPFTPSTGELFYGLKISRGGGGEEIVGYPLEVVISNARIVVTQEAATKTLMQIPLFSSDYSYAWDGQGSLVCDPTGFHVYYAEGEQADSLDVFTNKWPVENTDTWVSSDELTNLWRYLRDELSIVSRVRFSVLARGARRYTQVPWNQVTINTLTDPPVLYNMGLYMVDLGSGDGLCNDASPSGWVSDSTEHFCDSRRFTPIPGSFVALTEAEMDTSGGPWSITLTPHFGAIGTGKHIHLGGDPFGGNPWGAYESWFDLDIAGGLEVIGATLTVSSSVNYVVRWELSYFIAPSIDSPLSVALYALRSVINVSEDTVLYDPWTGVPIDRQGVYMKDSTLTFDTDGDWIRKWAEIPTAGLINDTEVEFRVKCPGQIWASPSSGPEIADAQLLLNINPIDKLTIWQRIFHRADNEHDNWRTPVEWGGDYWNVGLGANSIMHRTKLVKPTNAHVYFEATAYTVAGTNETPADSQYLRLVDLTELDESGSGNSNKIIPNSILSWGNEDAGKRMRYRCGSIVADNGTVIGAKYGESEDGNIVPLDGFLVVKVNPNTTALVRTDRRISPDHDPIWTI